MATNSGWLSEAAIYTRISDDREGRELGVQRQQQDCLDLAEKLGLTVRPEHMFEDNDRGASTLSKKKRPDYERMLDLAQRRSFKYILAYSNSRLTRRPKEFEGLIELHKMHGIEFRTKVSGDDDLSTADGVMTARIKASIDAGEAERTGERVRRARLQEAQSGGLWRSMAGRVFGWTDDLITEHPIEAELIRQAADDILTGRRSRTQICRDWNAMGVTTTRGNDWHPAQLTQMLRSPRLAGYRQHQGEIALDREGQKVRGPQQPILTEETYNRLRLLGKVGTKKVRVGRPGRRTYLLSRYARCGVCNSPMTGQRIPDGRHNYSCNLNPAKRDHTNTASGRAVDRLVTARVILKSREASLAPVDLPEFDGSARLRVIDEDLRETMRKIREGSSIPKSVLWAQAEELGQEKEALEAEGQEWARRHVAPVAAQRLTLEEFWGMQVPEQQAHIATLLGPVIIQPPTERFPGSRFDERRVVFLRDEGLVLD